MTALGTEALFSFGGIDSAQDILSEFWRFDTERRFWTLLSKGNEGPPGRSWLTMGMSPDSTKVYVFGGFNVSHDLNDLWRFDIKKNQWRVIVPRSDLPPARDRHSMVSTNKNLYVFGGYNGNFLNDLYSYNFAENAWSLVQTTAPGTLGPTPRRSHSAAMGGNRMYVYGGNDGVQTFDTLWSIDFGSAQWQSMPTTSSPSQRTRGLLMPDGRGNVYLFGGYDGANYRYDLWVYSPGNGWNHIVANEAAPVERADFAGVGTRAANNVDKGRLFVFGGFDGQENYNDLMQYEIASNTWIPIA